jgi:membrane protein
MPERSSLVPASRLREVRDQVIAIVADSYDHWRSVRTIRLGAGIAYYALFAIVPLVVLAAALAGMLISESESVDFVRELIDGIPDIDPDAVATSIVDQVTRSTSGLGLIGVLSSVVAASLLFVALQDALNVIWEAPVRVGIRYSIRRRVLSGGVALLTALLFISSFLVQAFVGFAEGLIPGDVPVFESFARVLTAAASWVLGVATIALLFRLLPYATVSWRSAVVGAAITALLVALGTSLIGAYVSRFATTSLSGAAGSVFAFLLWVYYEAQIVLAGAVLTKTLNDPSGVSGRDAHRSLG